jgi:predicted nucleic acid-binding protein
MLIVDASCLFEALTAGAEAQAVRSRLEGDSDLAAPHIVDVEVFGIIRKTYLLGGLDSTAAAQAVEDLRLWSGERFAHGALLGRAWELRHAVRGWDAMYVALAEALDGTLLTTDQRLAQATGPRCSIEVV